MGLTGAVGLGAVGATVVAAWQTIKGYLLQLYGFFVCTISMDRTLKTPVFLYLSKEYRRVSFGTRYFGGIYDWLKSKRRVTLIPFEALLSDTPVTWVRGGRLLFMRATADNMTLTTWRFSFDVDTLVKQALESYADWLTTKAKSDRRTSRFYVEYVIGTRNSNNNKGDISQTSGKAEAVSSTAIVRETARCIGYDEQDIGETEHQLINNLRFDDDITAAFKEARFWKDSERWFQDRGVPWKTGWLFCGKPGCGKSMAALALAQELDMPLLSFDLSSMTNEDFVHKWGSAVSRNAMVLLEDIDAVFNGRQNITTTPLSPGLTFDCLLNTIDGVSRSNGIFLIITTNDITKLDSALAAEDDSGGIPTRPGRIDRILWFKELNREGRQWMAKKILGDFDEALWVDLLGEHLTDSGAQFQARCCRRARELFWKYLPAVEESIVGDQFKHTPSPNIGSNIGFATQSNMAQAVQPALNKRNW